MTNHYIRQDIERELILKGLTKEEIVDFINTAVAEKLDREKMGAI